MQPLSALLPKSATLDLALVVRGVAAYQVLVWHTIGSRAHNGVWAFANVTGTQCVWLFLAISGYLVSYGFVTGRYDSDRPRDLLDYAIARFLRIVPLYALVAIITFALLKRGLATPEPVSAHSLWKTLLFLDPQSTIPSQFWTLVLEMRFYLVFPLFYIASRRLGISIGTRLFIYVLLILVPFWRYFVGTGGLDDRTFVGNASHFFAGMLVHDAWIWLRRRDFFSRRSAISSLGFVAAVALVIPTYLYHRQLAVFWPVGSVLTDVAAVTILLAHKRLEERPVRAGVVLWLPTVLGTIAYGIYSWHSALLTVQPRLVMHLGTVTLITLALSVLSFRYFEMPILGLRRRLIHRAFLGVPSEMPAAAGDGVLPERSSPVRSVG